MVEKISHAQNTADFENRFEFDEFDRENIFRKKDMKKYGQFIQKKQKQMQKYESKPIEFETNKIRILITFQNSIQF